MGLVGHLLAWQIWMEQTIVCSVDSWLTPLKTVKRKASRVLVLADRRVFVMEAKHPPLIIGTLTLPCSTLHSEK